MKGDQILNIKIKKYILILIITCSIQLNASCLPNNMYLKLLREFYFVPNERFCKNVLIKNKNNFNDLNCNVLVYSSREYLKEKYIFTTIEKTKDGKQILNIFNGYDNLNNNIPYQKNTEYDSIMISIIDFIKEFFASLEEKIFYTQVLLLSCYKLHESYSNEYATMILNMLKRLHNNKTLTKQDIEELSYNSEIGMLWKIWKPSRSILELKFITTYFCQSNMEEKIETLTKDFDLNNDIEKTNRSMIKRMSNKNMPSEKIIEIKETYQYTPSQNLLNICRAMSTSEIIKRKRIKAYLPLIYATRNIPNFYECYK